MSKKNPVAKNLNLNKPKVIPNKKRNVGYMYDLDDIPCDTEGKYKDD